MVTPALALLIALTILKTEAQPANSSVAVDLCACVQPPRLETEDDEYYAYGFHPCGVTRRGMQQKLEERVAVTGKEEKRQQSAQRVQEEEIGQKHAIKGCMHHRGWALL